MANRERDSKPPPKKRSPIWVIIPLLTLLICGFLYLYTLPNDSDTKTETEDQGKDYIARRSQAFSSALLCVDNNLKAQAIDSTSQKKVEFVINLKHDLIDSAFIIEVHTRPSLQTNPQMVDSLISTYKTMLNALLKENQITIPECSL